MRVVALLACLAALGACRASGETTGSPSSTASTSTASSTSGSTTSGPPSTVVPPTVPASCERDALALWTSRVDPVAPADFVADAVIRIENRGDVRCELDVGAGPSVDPLIEPTVWLEPAGAAELVVTSTGQECFGPAVALETVVAIGAVSATVPTAAVAPCSLHQAALYPVDPPSGSCASDDLAATATDAFALVTTTRGCELGPLVGFAVDGETVDPVTAAEPPAVEVSTLEPRDVVAFPLRTGTRCRQGTSWDATLVFASGAEIVVELADCRHVEIGPGRPYFGDPDGPRPTPDEPFPPSLTPFAE